MKLISVFSIFLLMSFNAIADTDVFVEKPYNIGVALYGSAVTADDSSVIDNSFGGLALSFGYVVTNQFMLRANFFSLEEEDNSDLTSRGFDLLAYFGTGFATQGLKAYIGGGVFKDKWENGPNSKSFDGLQIGGGFGYNWESVSLELQLNLRSARDYEDFINEGQVVKNDVAAASSALLLSYRF